MIGVPTVIGLDLSLTGSGIASSVGWCERIGFADITKMPLIRRVAIMRVLTEKLLDLIGRPDLVVVEVPAFSRSGGGVIERAALYDRVTSALVDREIPVAEAFNQHRMRYATGKGAASKGAIVDAVARRWPAFETGGDDNKADAVILAAMGADHLGIPLASVPQTHRAGLTGVRWPDLGVAVAA